MTWSDACYRAWKSGYLYNSKDRKNQIQKYAAKFSIDASCEIICLAVDFGLSILQNTHKFEPSQ